MNSYHPPFFLISILFFFLPIFLFFSSFLPIITIAYHHHLCLSPLPPSSYLFFNLTASHLPVLHSSLLSAPLPSYIFTPSYLSVSPPSYIFIHLCPLTFLYSHPSIPSMSLYLPILSTSFSLFILHLSSFSLSVIFTHFSTSPLPTFRLPIYSSNRPSPFPFTPFFPLPIYYFLHSSAQPPICTLHLPLPPPYVFLSIFNPRHFPTYPFKSLPFFILQSTKGYYKFNVSSGKTITNRSILAVPEDVLFNFCLPFLTFCTASSLYSLNTTGGAFLPFDGLKMVSTSPGMYDTNLVMQIRLFSAGFDQDFAVCFGSIFDPPYCFMTS